MKQTAEDIKPEHAGSYSVDASPPLLTTLGLPGPGDQGRLADASDAADVAEISSCSPLPLALAWLVERCLADPVGMAEGA